MDFALTLAHNGQPSMSLEPARDMRNNVLLSLHVRKGSFFQNLEFGSSLHEIKTLTDANVRLAKQYAEEALGWIAKVPKVEGLKVTTRADSGRLEIVIEYKALGVQGQITTHFRVE